MHRSQPLINLAWSLTTEQPVLRALSSQNVHLLTYPVKKKIQDIESLKVHTLVARRAEHPTPGQTLSTL
jgi:hypothetical protein